MTSLNTEYQITKLIKKGKAILSHEFVDIANWIESTYNVKILNIIYDTIDNTNRPRLWLILEYEKDAVKLRSLYGFGTTKQLEMSSPFIKLISDRLIKHKTEKIWIVITSFEEPAKEEARWAVSENEVETLQSELNIKELWKIYPEMYYTATFFLFTDEQVKQFSQNGMKELFTTKYFEILKRHDEFGYYQKNEFSIELESKETFETNYENSWFNYSRR